ncbi:MAG: alpha-glucosidase [Promethearchaeota archaeon]
MSNEYKEDNEYKEEVPWWKKTVVYQIYPRSFMDSNGDGIGDLKGIISKLDYIKQLGVETIWFSPFYESPTFKPYSQHDCGYDIMNYKGINPEYGDMDIADELIKEIHARDMKIVLDMVLNHTSIEHPWFKESRSSKDNPKRDWYIWRKGRKPTKKMPGGKKPPNNWRSMILKSGWHYDPTTHEYYWAQFLWFQPDLNYRNPEVQNEMLDVVRYWLKKDVDGFRLDIISALFEDAEFRDNPRTLKLFSSDFSELYLFQKPIYTIHHPDTFEFLKKLRQTIDEFKNPERFMVGEVSAPIKILRKYVGENGKTDRLNLVFLFQSMATPFKAKSIRKLIQSYEEHFHDPYLPTWVFGNHDRTRRISKLGNSILKAKLNAALQLTARGVPFIYYGEEIGMENGYTSKKESRDAVVHHFSWIPEVFMNLAYILTKETINRDFCRTPMQWDDSANAGFTKENVYRTWLPITKSYKERNVKVQSSDPNSLLNCYKRFLKARKETPALNQGSLKILKIPDIPKCILTYERRIKLNNKKQIAYIFLNFSKKPLIFRNHFKNVSFLVSTNINNNPLTQNRIIMTPWEGFVVIEIEKD